jgi:RES domain-containing protein
LSGVGAARYPGRWNKQGQSAVYTSENPATALAEKLVHLDKDTIPSNYALMTIQVDCRDATEGRGGIFFQTARNQVGAMLFQVLDPTILGFLVPSVVVSAWNIVLYPEHPEFDKRVSILSVEPFEFDPRLFPPTAMPETAER